MNVLRWLLIPWEAIFSWAVQARPVPGGSGVMRWVVHPYSGPRVGLADGTIIQPGDAVLEIHFANARIHKVATAAKKPFMWAVAEAFRHDFAALTTAVQCGEIPAFTALYGMTLMGPGARRFGFELIEVSDSRANRWVAWWEKLLKAAFHPTKGFREATAPETAPEMAFMSHAALLARYARPRRGRPGNS